MREIVVQKSIKDLCFMIWVCVLFVFTILPLWLRVLFSMICVLKFLCFVCLFVCLFVFLFVWLVGCLFVWLQLWWTSWFITSCVWALNDLCVFYVFVCDAQHIHYILLISLWSHFCFRCFWFLKAHFEINTWIIVRSLWGQSDTVNNKTKWKLPMFW